MYKITPIICTIMSSLILFLELGTVFDEVGSLPAFIFVLLLIINIIPIIITGIIALIAKKYKLGKAIYTTLSTILIMIAFVYLIIFGFGMTGAALFWDTTPKQPAKSKYNKELANIKSQYNNNGFEHFPENLPKNAEDYFFEIENSFDGEDTHYVTFTTDRSFVEKELSDKCDTIYTKNELYENDITIYTSKFSYADEYCIIHKSTKTQRYVSGIATDKNHEQIYYFYGNY